MHAFGPNQKGDAERERLRGVPEGGRYVGALAPLSICGHVGCCDSSKNRHATKHFKATGHPMPSRSTGRGLAVVLYR